LGAAGSRGRQGARPCRGTLIVSATMPLGRPCSSCSASIGLTLSVQLSPHAETPVAPADLEPAASLIAKLPAWKIGWEK